MELNGKLNFHLILEKLTEDIGTLESAPIPPPTP
jgi:hypothetical protein